MTDRVGKCLSYVNNTLGICAPRDKYGARIDEILDELSRNSDRPGDRILTLDCGKDVTFVRTDGGILVFAAECLFLEAE